MVVFSALRRHATLQISRSQCRNFALGGSHGPPPEWEGIDKVVRAKFPEDYQLAIAILGGYTGLYVVYKIKSAVSGGKTVEEAPKAAPAPATTTTTSGTFPSVESPDFDKFVESEAFAKLLESEDQLNKVLT